MRFQKRTCFSGTAALCALLPLVTASLGITAVPAHAQSITWQQLPIKGGGWVTGMVFSNDSTAYCRCDVGGVYRRDGNRWTQLIVSGAFANNPDIVRPRDQYGNLQNFNNNIYSVESLAVDPNNSANVWVAAGDGFSYGGGYLLHSTDSGRTFVKSPNFPGLKMAGNDAGRVFGERLSVDPNNSNIVYFGSRSNGLYVTYNANDAAPTWQVIGAVDRGSIDYDSNGNEQRVQQGINVVVFDSSRTHNYGLGPVSDTYVASNAKGIYKTDSAGAYWDIITGNNGGPNNSDFVTGMKVSGGKLFVVAANRVWIFTPGSQNSQGSWRQITPPGSSGLDHIAVAPTNSNHIVVTDGGMGTLWRSNDGGNNWDNMPRTVSSGNEWRTNYNGNGFLSVGQILFNPNDDTDLWFAEGFGTFRTSDAVNNAPGQNVNWYNISDGIEETVAQDVVASGGNVNVATWDLQGFHFNAYNPQIPDRQLGPAPNSFSLGQSIAMSANNQNVIALVSSDQRNYFLTNNYSGISYNGGQNDSWNYFPSITVTGQLPYNQGDAHNNSPYGLRLGIIAIAANSPSNLCWFPSTSGQTNGETNQPYYTTDAGAHWYPAYGIPNNNDGLYIYSSGVDKKPLCADGGVDNKFYYYDEGSAQVFASTNSGATFTAIGSPLNSGASSVGGVQVSQLRAEPGVGNNLWFAGGFAQYNNQPGGALQHSINGGQSFTGITTVEACWQVGFGAPYPGYSNPTVYIYGRISGQYGVYASTDEGASWQFLGDYPLGIFDRVHCINGDMSIFGRVYVGFGGNGFAYGTATLNAPQFQPTDLTVN